MKPSAKLAQLLVKFIVGVAMAAALVLFMH